MNEAAGLAAATVGYPSPLFVTQAQFQLQKLITERNITEIAHEAHHDQAVH
jgi:hypothetical protein